MFSTMKDDIKPDNIGLKNVPGLWEIGQCRGYTGQRLNKKVSARYRTRRVPRVPPAEGLPVDFSLPLSLLCSS